MWCSEFIIWIKHQLGVFISRSTGGGGGGGSENAIVFRGSIFSNTDPLSIGPTQTMPVKMLITFEPHGLFGSSFSDLFILILSSH